MSLRRKINTAGLVQHIPYDELNECERALLAAVDAGVGLGCADRSMEELAETEDPSSTIRAQVIRGILLGHYDVTLAPSGIQVMNARIVGWFDLRDTASSSSVSLLNCHIDQPLRAWGAHLRALDLSGSALPGLYGEHMQLIQDALFQDGCRIEGSNKYGLLRLSSAHIGGNLELSGDVTLTNRSGPVLVAENLEVDGSIFMRGIHAEGSGAMGLLLLGRASVRSDIEVTGATLANPTGPGLMFAGVEVGGDVRISTVSSPTSLVVDALDRAAITLLGAKIEGALSCSGMTVENRSGLAMDASMLNAGSVHLDRIIAKGRGPIGCIRLAYSTIRQILNVFNISITNPDDPALDLRSTSVGTLRLRPKWISGDVQLDGLKYDGLHADGVDTATWKRWLGDQSPRYAAQPYQQYAAVQRAAGHEAVARDILILQQKDRRKRGDIGGFWARSGHRFFGALVGYGYRPLRTLIWLVLVILLAFGLGLAAGHVQSEYGLPLASRPTTGGARGEPCSTVEQIGMGLDRALPIINTGGRDVCKLDSTTRTSVPFVVGFWLLQLFSWAAATLLVAGYTAVIRKA
jgi:hypothetical protein